MSTTEADAVVDDSSGARSARVVQLATLPAAVASDFLNPGDSNSLHAIRAVAGPIGSGGLGNRERDFAAVSTATTTSVLPRHILIQSADGVCIPMLTHIAVL